MANYSIKDIELLTGIKAHTLRIWEQRYNIPAPKRTETNIRFYDDDDLKLLLNISLLNRNGHKISEIVSLSQKEISDLAVNYSLLSNKNPVQIQTLINAMIEMDEAAFERVLSTCILQSGLENTMMEIVFPFMNAVGVLWQTGTVVPAYEHFSTNIIRQKLIMAIDGQPIRNQSSVKKFLLFLPEGEWHELGLLFANYLIRSSGNHSIYLGQNVPIADLLSVAKRYQPDFIFLSMTTAFTQEYTSRLLSLLKKEIPDSVLLGNGYNFLDNPDIPPVNIIQVPADLRKFF
ncbi:MAG: MerR family transcriptional regulator [Bacteroidetes bacterium]|nr:MerR family transcriptional regulator [Bacteroidota bacterium]